MADAALGLGASVITFLALAGQTLRGCQYIHDFIEDARRSSRDLDDLSREVEHLRDAIFGLQDLQGRMGQTWADGGLATQAIHTLESGYGTIEDVEKFFKRFDARKSEWWTDLKVASKRRQLAIFNRRLGAANVQMIMVHSRFILRSALSQDENIQLLTASLESNANTTLRHLSDLQSTMLALEHSSYERTRNFQIERDLVLQRVDMLPIELSSVIQTSITSALQKSSSRIQSNHQSQTSLTSNSSQVLLPDWYRGYKIPVGLSGGPEDAKALPGGARHIQQRTVFSIYLATIEIRYMSVVDGYFDKENGNKCQTMHARSDLLTTIDVRLRTSIVRKGLQVSILNQRTGRSLPGSSFKFRLYSIVPESSPIVEACKQGNTAVACELFSTGQARLQDVVRLNIPTNSGVTEISLLTYVWMTWILTVRELNTGKFDESSQCCRDLLDRLEQQYEIFKFLAIASIDDCDRHLGRSVFDCCTPDNLCKSGNTLAAGKCQASRDAFDSGPCLWDILHMISSCHPALTEHIAKMITLFTTKLPSSTAESATPYQQEILEICCELMPELTSCFGSLGKPHANPIQHGRDETSILCMDLSSSSYSSIDVGTGIYALLRDPDALHFRTFLQYQVQPNNSHMADTCILAQQNSYALELRNYASCEAAVKARIVACLRFGMDIQTLGSSHETVLGHFVCSGKFDLVQIAWAEAGLEKESLLSMVEEYRCFFIVEELNTLRPLVRLMESELRPGQDEKAKFTAKRNVFDCCVEMMKSERYLKYFPEEAQHINTYVDQHNPGSKGDNSEVQYEVLKSELDAPFPAINGLSDDFWI